MNKLAKLFYNKIGMERAFKFNKKISRFLVFNRTMNKKPEWEGEIWKRLATFWTSYYRPSPLAIYFLSFQTGNVQIFLQAVYKISPKIENRNYLGWFSSHGLEADPAASSHLKVEEVVDVVVSRIQGADVGGQRRWMERPNDLILIFDPLLLR